MIRAKADLRAVLLVVERQVGGREGWRRLLGRKGLGAVVGPRGRGHVENAAIDVRRHAHAFALQRRQRGLEALARLQGRGNKQNTSSRGGSGGPRGPSQRKQAHPPGNTRGSVCLACGAKVKQTKQTDKVRARTTEGAGCKEGCRARTKAARDFGLAVGVVGAKLVAERVPLVPVQAKV